MFFFTNFKVHEAQIYFNPTLWYHYAAAAKSLQLCLTLCDPIDCSPPGSLVPGILQARTPEWGAISFSNAWKSKVKVKSLSHVQLFATPWTTAYQAPPSMGFSRQEYWSGVPLPSLVPSWNLNNSRCVFSFLFILYYLDPEHAVCCTWSLSCVQFFATPRTAACQTPLSMGILQARILEWVAIPSSRVSSQPRGQTQVSHIAGRFFTVWATREAQGYWSG